MRHRYEPVAAEHTDDYTSSYADFYADGRVSTLTERFTNVFTDNLIIIILFFAVLICALYLFSRGSATPPSPTVSVRMTSPRFGKPMTFEDWEDYRRGSLHCTPLDELRSHVNPNVSCSVDGEPHCYDIGTLFEALLNITRDIPLACTTFIPINWSLDGTYSVPCACAHHGGLIVEPRVLSRSSKKCKVTDALPLFGGRPQTAKVPCTAVVTDVFSHRIEIDSSRNNILRRAVEIAQKKPLF